MESQQERESLISLLEEKALLCRKETVRLITIAGSGHYGTAFSCAEILVALYYHTMRHDPQDPKWPDRDRFIFSKGHGAVGLYPLLADLGYFPWEDLDGYCRLGSWLADHPSMKIAGIDFGAGSLGHGLSVAAGMALGARLDGRSYRVYCLLGDGELDEGQIWEAAMSAAHFKLGNLVAIVDRNQVSVSGFTEEVMALEPLASKWGAFGWEVLEIDGHDLRQVVAAFESLPPPDSSRPTVIIAHTIPGKGISYMEGRYEWHVGYLGEEDRDRAIEELEARR